MLRAHAMYRVFLKRGSSHVLVVSGLPLATTMEQDGLKTVASWAATTVVRLPATKLRRRSDGSLNIYFANSKGVDVTSVSR